VAANQLKTFLYHVKLYTAWEFLQVRGHLVVLFVSLFFICLFCLVFGFFLEGAGCLKDVKF